MPTALITGASAGIGAAIARALAPTHDLLLPGRPSDRLTAVAAELGAATWPMDLHDTEAIAVDDRLPDRLDVLVHNAGVALPARVAESTVPQWRDTMAVNIIGPVALTLAVLPALRAAEGHVVFINSGSGFRSSPGLASYSASKFALRAFADSLRADEPVLRVTSVHPGRTDSAMQRGLVAYEGGEYDPARFLRPETVAGLVADAVATPPDGHVHEIVVRPR
ncbi:SDR family oxidoreductase [Mycolicibacillus trivialis]|uniref:Short-chain dehydrogenase n=1 Tax=Mycolicibacillus trivialis TaxID=1798 RepID=A0A1X2EK26_9MYCO|nr:SDR family oxidoreductase [Mycolicibacillus trivialis]ORX04142.1 short-chain dehydrogenase [Mycolicibacillus trivialis]